MLADSSGSEWVLLSSQEEQWIASGKINIGRQPPIYVNNPFDTSQSSQALVV